MDNIQHQTQCDVLNNLKDVFYRICKVCNDSKQLEYKAAAKLETEKLKCISKPPQ